MATIQGQSANQGFYGGTHGNMSTAIGKFTGTAAINDVIVLGNLPQGLIIKRVSAGTAVANASTTIDINAVKEDGSSVVLAAALDVNNKVSSKDLMPVETGFSSVEIQAVVKGGTIAAGSNLTIYVEYLAVGTK